MWHRENGLGAVYGLGAAVLFGLTTPILKLFLPVYDLLPGVGSRETDRDRAGGAQPLGRVPQLSGAGALAGIGFTMSPFIAGVAFPDLMDYAAAKVGIFLASLLAGGLGIVILWAKESGIDVAADSAVNANDVKGP